MLVVAVVAGVPLMTGGRFAACTVMVKAGSDAVAVPSDTEMAMFEWVPADVGVPLSRPVVVLNVAQEGLFAMPNASVWPSGSETAGVNE